jgi:beta-lactamase class D
LPTSSVRSDARVLVVASVLLSALNAAGSGTRSDAPPAVLRSCFLLYKAGGGIVRRTPSSSCDLRVSPQSTFKIPHALAALDSGVIPDVETPLAYDGRPLDVPLWRRDHTLATAMRYSVVWYFQEIAKKLGADREREYLERFDYGNRDAASGLTSFWLGGSLTISPDEQLRFLQDFFGFGQKLAVSPRALDEVQRILVQPTGHITNATGEHPFGSHWPPGMVLSAKTGSGSTGDGRAVRWLVGRVQQGGHSWIFVSNVVGSTGLAADAAIEQAARALSEEHILR